MLAFRSEAHLERWLQSRKMPLGGILTLDQGWRLAQAWYRSDRRDPNWRRRTLDEVEALFAEIGLTGEYWKLRPD